MNKRIALIQLSTGTLTYLTDEKTAAISPSWSPDGQHIAYVSAPDIGDVVGGPPAKEGLAQRRIWIMDRDGSHKHPLTHDATYRDEYPLWSADGQFILFARLEAAKDLSPFSLWLVPAAGGEPRQVVDDLTYEYPDTTQNWFGFYGYINWDATFDWWRGTVATLPTSGGRSADYFPLLTAGLIALLIAAVLNYLDVGAP